MPGKFDDNQESRTGLIARLYCDQTRIRDSTGTVTE